MVGKIFDLDSPFMRFLLTAWDILVLNVLTIICMLPVITIGPALKALSFSCLKIVRGKDGNIAKYYFKNFILNFWQTAALGGIFIAVLLFMTWSVWVIVANKLGFMTLLVWGIVAFIVVLAMLYIFPMQGRFKNPLMSTIKNAFWASLIQLPKSLLMFLCWLFLPALALFVSENFTPVIFLYGISLPAFLNAEILNPLFEEMEDRINEVNGTKTKEDPFEESSDEEIFEENNTEN